MSEDWREKINAIKQLRACTPLTLKDAKDALEQWMAVHPGGTWDVAWQDLATVLPKRATTPGEQIEQLQRELARRIRQLSEVRADLDDATRQLTDLRATLEGQSAQIAKLVVVVRWAVANNYAPPPLCDALEAWERGEEG